MGKKWTDREKEFLKDNYLCMTNEELSEKLNRSIATIKKRKSILGLVTDKRWEIWEEEYLKENRDCKTVEELAKHLNRSYNSTVAKCSRLNLNVVELWEEQEKDFIRNNYTQLSNYEMAIALNRTQTSVVTMKSKLGLKVGRAVKAGDIFNSLTVIKESHVGKDGKVYYICKCSCGNTSHPIEGYNLSSGHTKTCGGFKHKDLTGRTFGELKVIKLSHTDYRGNSHYICECSCGGFTKPIRVDVLTGGYATSCGCMSGYRGEMAIKDFFNSYTYSEVYYKEKEKYKGLYFKDSTRELISDGSVYDSEGNLLFMVEYDGEQHFRPVNWSGKMSKEELVEQIKDQKTKDMIKNNYCKDRGIRLVRIPYWDYDNIEDILTSELF